MRIILATWLALFCGQAAYADDHQQVIAGNQAFARELYKQLRANTGNIFLSPYSVSTALAMTTAGARSKTETEMLQTLQQTLPAERLHPAMGSVIQSLNQQSTKGDYQLQVANALWVQQGGNFLEPFMRTNQTHYRTQVTPLDFITAPEPSRQTINDWVARATQDKIRDLLSMGTVTTDTRLVLTNAIYFKGYWETAFTASATSDMPFKVGQAQTMPVATMHMTKPFAYGDTELYQLLALPYRGGDLSMIIILPREGKSMADIESALTMPDFTQRLNQLSAREVQLALPKFRISSGFSLKSALEAMGMRTSFTPQADFSGINGQPNYFISDVVHKAFVEVDEQGTEAAAATGVVMRATSAAMPTSPVPFIVDHPFLLIIRDQKTGLWLFMGRVDNPTA
ncbi:MAG: serpin family protein [Rickettsiales bacterium]|nr:serpin family protein [Rickettsiales bacterium]